MPHILHYDDFGPSHMNDLPDSIDWDGDPLVAAAKEKEKDKEKPEPAPELEIYSWSWGDTNVVEGRYDEIDSFSWGTAFSTTDDFGLIG